MSNQPDWKSLHFEYHIRALEQLLHVQENSVLEQTRQLVTEIAEHKNTEGKLRSLHNQLDLILQSVGDGIYGLDPAGNIIFWNAAAERMTGFSQEDALGQNAHAMFHHSHPDGTPYDPAECKIYRALHQESLAEISNEVYWRKDGSSFPVEFLSRPMVENGKIVGAVVTFQDISQRLEQERHIKNAEEQAWRTQKLAGIGELAGGMCHEILNPLNIIALQVQLLMMDKNSDPKLLESLERIRDQAQRIQKTVQSIDRFTNRKPGPAAETDLNVKMSETLDMMRGELKLLDISVEEHYDSRLPRAQVNPEEIQQMFLNVLLNAKESIPTGGTLQVTTLPDPKGGVLIIISDTGEGIAPENLERIFDPYYTTRRETYGRGLGLTLCHHIVKEARGSLSLTSTPGKGTRVQINLPAASGTGDGRS